MVKKKISTLGSGLRDGDVKPRNLAADTTPTAGQLPSDQSPDKFHWLNIAPFSGKHTDLTDKEVAGVIDHADNSIPVIKLKNFEYNPPSNGQIPYYISGDDALFWSDPPYIPPLPTTWPSLIGAAFVGASFALVKSLAAGSHTIQIQWTRQVPELDDWYVTCRPDLPDPYHGFEHMRLIIQYGLTLLQHALVNEATSSQTWMTWEDVIDAISSDPMALTFTIPVGGATVLIMLSTACTLTSSATYASRAALLLRIVLDGSPLEGSECFGRSGFYGNAASYPDGST